MEETMTQQASARKQQNYRLDAPTREALRVMAEMEKRSQANIIELAVEEYFLNHYTKLLEKTMQKVTANKTAVFEYESQQPDHSEKYYTVMAYCDNGENFSVGAYLDQKDLAIKKARELVGGVVNPAGEYTIRQSRNPYGIKIWESQ
jgi:hypothetical protein